MKQRLLPQHAASLHWMYASKPANTQMQATGTIQGLSFYFWAKWDYWTFSVAQTADIDPVDVLLNFEPGYSTREQYGKREARDASWMPLAEAERIIEQCAQTFMRDRVS